MDGRSVVLLDGEDAAGKVYHKSHQVLSSGFSPVLPRDRRRNGSRLRQAVSIPCHTTWGIGGAGKAVSTEELCKGRDSDRQETIET